MIITCRAIVDDEGTVRLLGLIKLKEGAHVLATLVDRDALVWLYSNEVELDQIKPTQKHPDLRVHEFADEDILSIADENRKAAIPDSSPTPFAISDYRGIVDSKSTIRLLNPVELKEGTHILVTLVDWDSPISSLGWSGRTGLSEDRIRNELLEDEAWAYLLKDVP